MAYGHSLITADEFGDALNDDKPVLVKFGAPWCPPCQGYDREVGDIVDEFHGRVSFYEVNTDDEKNSRSDAARSMKRVSKLGSGIPHVCIFKNGELQDTIVGLNVPGVRNAISEAFTS